MKWCFHTPYDFITWCLIKYAQGRFYVSWRDLVHFQPRTINLSSFPCRFLVSGDEWRGNIVPQRVPFNYSVTTIYGYEFRF